MKFEVNFFDQCKCQEWKIQKLTSEGFGRVKDSDMENCPTCWVGG